MASPFEPLAASEFSDLEAQFLDRLSRQFLAQQREDPAFVVVRQLLHEHGAVGLDLEDAALEAEDARVPIVLFANGFAPGALQVEARLPTSPAAGGEQVGED